MAQRTEIEPYLHTLLAVDQFRDYGPNGVQVEGCGTINHLVSGVTASLDLIDAAIQAKADAILVHHGLFWKGMDGRVTGWLKRRLQKLLAHDITLLAYHLPLDAHPLLGNNAQLARRLGLVPQGRFGEQNLGLIGPPLQAMTCAELVDQLTVQLGRAPLVVGKPMAQALTRVAWCSGGAQSYFESAIAAGAQVFITGELSEPQAHLARETGVVFLACGHHATERYGVQAVGEHLVQRFTMTHQFIDIDNPA